MNRDHQDGWSADRLLDDILVGVGGSRHSLAALEYAAELTAAANSVMRVLIVEENAIPSAFLAAERDHLSRLASDMGRLACLSAGMAEEQALEIASRREVSFEILRRSGDVVGCIIAAAEDATLVAMGKKGHRDEHRGLLGSNTEKIVRLTHRPLLLTPGAYQPIRAVRIAHGVRDRTLSVVSCGLAVATALDLPAAVVTVAPGREECERAWAVLEEGRVSERAQLVAETGQVAQAIVRGADASTLIVIGAYNHARLYQHLVGSTAEEVMRSSPGPVLLIGRPRPAPAVA